MSLIVTTKPLEEWNKRNNLLCSESSYEIIYTFHLFDYLNQNESKCTANAKSLSFVSQFIYLFVSKLYTSNKPTSDCAVLFVHQDKIMNLTHDPSS